MHRKVSRAIHRLDTLEHTRRDALVAELVSLDDAVFRDPTPAHVVDGYRGVGVDECWVMVVRKGEQLIGYNVIRIWFEEGPTGRYALWRSRAAVLRDHRRGAITGQFAILMFFLFRARHPRTPAYAVNTLIHPSSFRLFATRVSCLYPFPQTELSAEHRAIYDRAFHLLGLVRVDGAPDFVVADPTVVDSEPAEDAFWARSTAPCIRFFMEHNPDYRQGRAIVAFNPMTVRTVVGMGLRHALRRLEKAARRWLGRPELTRGPVARPSLVDRVQT